MTWTTKKPAMADPLSEFPEVLRDRKSDLSNAIGTHFYWQESSGASAGVPRFSQDTTNPGSARAFFGAESQVSARHDGALMLASDTFRLAALTSDQSVVIGGKRAVVAYSASSATPTEQYAVESGITSAIVGGATVYNQGFTSAFSAAPVVTACAGWSVLTAGYTVAVTAVNASGFSFQVGRFNTTLSSNSATVMWLAYGRRAI